MKPALPLLLAVLLLSACDQRTAADTTRTVEVAVVTLKAKPVALQTELSGRTSASLMAEVRPQVTGIIQTRLFEEGAQVKAGQVLYQIDPAPYQAAYDQADAELASAQAAVSAARLKDTRYADLRKIEGVSKQEADDAHTASQQALAAVAQKKAALASARINLDYTKVRAPIAGRIGKSSVTPGALVTASQTTALATLRALDPMFVDLTQSSAEMLKLRKLLDGGSVKAGGTSVSLTLEDGSTYANKGTLKFAEVAVDEATGSVTLRAEFPNPDGTLLPGMFVRAGLEEAVNPNAILAPQQGITRDVKGNATALVVNAENKVEQRSVATLRVIGDQWLVREGLVDGDRVIVEGLNKVRPGDMVRAVPFVPQQTSSAETATRLR